MAHSAFPVAASTISQRLLLLDCTKSLYAGFPASAASIRACNTERIASVFSSIENASKISPMRETGTRIGMSQDSSSSARTPAGSAPASFHASCSFFAAAQVVPSFLAAALIFAPPETGRKLPFRVRSHSCGPSSQIAAAIEHARSQVPRRFFSLR